MLRKRLIANLTPFIPLSTLGEGEREERGGEAPSKTPYNVFRAGAPLRHPKSKRVRERRSLS